MCCGLGEEERTKFRKKKKHSSWPKWVARDERESFLSYLSRFLEVAILPLEAK